jgi:hypothetical protein
MIWTSIDPGIKYYAWATWCTDTLAACGIAGLDERQPVQDMCVVERPVNQGRTLIAQTLPDLCWSGALVAGRFKERREYSFAVWAGSLDDATIERRVWLALSDVERALLPKLKKERVHVLAAIGVGLYHLKVEGLRG